ncbi:hypothetical protein ACVBEQ_00340 [Nakamurella sp. GG22]
MCGKKQIPGLTSLRPAPDVMLAVHRRLRTDAFHYLDWVTGALIAGN